MQSTNALEALVRILGPLELTDGYLAIRRTINQDIAKELMSSRNPKFQRELKSRTKSFIRQQLKAAQWIDDSVMTIGFVDGSDDFYIVNGQHRLSVLQETKNVTMTVLLHILSFASEEQLMVYATTAVDANAQRSPVDQLSIAGITEDLTEKQKPLARTLGPALHLIWARMRGTGGGTDKPMPMPMKISAFRDWLPYATAYVEQVQHSPDCKNLLQRSYLAVGMVTFRSQEALAKRFWNAVAARDERLAGFWHDVVGGNTKDEIGPLVRTPQALARATAGAYNMFILGQDAMSWEDILDHMEELKEATHDEWHEAPFHLLGSPYDGVRQLTYEPDAEGPGFLNSNSAWSKALPAEGRDDSAGTASGAHPKDEPALADPSE